MVFYETIFYTKIVINMILAVFISEKDWVINDAVYILYFKISSFWFFEMKIFVAQLICIFAIDIDYDKYGK